MNVIVVFAISRAFINIVFLVDEFFIFLVNRGGSLSSTVNVSCGIKLESIFKIVLFRMTSYSLIFIFTKALFQSDMFMLV